MSLITNNEEDRINLLYDSSSYHTQKDWVSKKKDSTFKYYCVYTINSKDQPSFYYSSIKGKHFGIPKLIWSNGRISSVGSYLDTEGKYGLTQFSYAIVDNITNLKKIKKIFDSKYFRKLMECCAVKQLSINYKILALFKKDFYKEFIDKKAKASSLKSSSPKKIKLERRKSVGGISKYFRNI